MVVAILNSPHEVTGGSAILRQIIQSQVLQLVSLVRQSIQSKSANCHLQWTVHRDDKAKGL